MLISVGISRFLMYHVVTYGVTGMIWLFFFLFYRIIIHELAHVISDLGGSKSCSAASGADFSAPEVGFYYPFETRLVVLGMNCKFCIFAV